MLYISLGGHLVTFTMGPLPPLLLALIWPSQISQHPPSAYPPKYTIIYPGNASPLVPEVRNQPSCLQGARTVESPTRWPTNLTLCPLLLPPPCGLLCPPHYSWAALLYLLVPSAKETHKTPRGSKRASLITLFHLQVHPNLPPPYLL